MWGEDKKEAEIDKIRRAVEYRKRIAVEAGLDRLLLDVYHRSVRYYPLWITGKRDRQYVYPGVSSATEKIIKNPSGDVFVTEFSLAGKKYKIMSVRRGNIIARDVYYVIELFLDENKVFAISEKHDVSLKDAHYYTLNIDAYASDGWVEDFRHIWEYQKRVDKAVAKEPAEDKELSEKLRKDFNLANYDDKVIRVRAWPRYKVWRLFLLLIILILVFFTFLEFRLLVNR